MEKTEKDSVIADLLNRGVVSIYPSKEFLEKELKSGKRLTIYHGIDPTGPSLHLGHVIQLLKLAEFQRLGHKIILLIGDFTATIGDPTDKLAARVPLTREQVMSNCRLYKKQASKFISFHGENKAELKYNSRWFGKMTMADALHLFSQITYAQTIKRDMFQKRIAEGKDLYIHEFMYPALQGYDSVVMDVDGEIGGNDQTFNMLFGRDMLKKTKNKEKFVLTTKLLTDISGKKMGKTEGNMVALTDSPHEMYGKIMSWADEMMEAGFELCVGSVALNKARADLSAGKNPKEVKARLAFSIVEMCHSKKDAVLAEKAFENAFSRKAPDSFCDVSAKAGDFLSDVLVGAGIVSSKSEFWRLIASGSIENLEEKTKIADPKAVVSKEMKIRIGKKKFVRIAI